MVLTVLRYNFCLPKAGEVRGFREGLPHVVYTIVTSDRKKKKKKEKKRRRASILVPVRSKVLIGFFV